MARHTRDYFREKQGEKNRANEIAANSINLPEFLISLGCHVKKTSTKDDFEVKNSPLGKIRLKFKEVWLCFVDNDKPMNAIQLVERLSSCTKKEAIKQILGLCSEKHSIKDNTYAIEMAEEKEGRDLQKMPEPTDAHIAAGIIYLNSRGIDQSTFEMLRNSGNAQYAWNGLAFIGRDSNGAPKLMETRLINPLPNINKLGKFIKHLVEEGSQRKYAIVINGSNPKSIEIVEGNFDGMALYEMNKRLLPVQSTIIISGGKDNMKFLENPDIVEILKNAESVKCYGDNEKLDLNDFDDKAEYLEALNNKQSVTDAAHMKRIEQIKIINPVAIFEYHKPPAEHSDLAELNKKSKEVLSKAALAKPKIAKKFNF